MGTRFPQPHPDGGIELVYPHVLKDIEERVQAGLGRYGTYLHTHNGRNALWDAYEEALDLAMYLRQRILEDESSLSSPE